MKLLFIIEIIFNILALIWGLKYIHPTDCMEARYFNLQDCIHLFMLVLILDVVLSICELSLCW